MSIRVLSESLPKARKPHDCMACEFILASGVDGFGYSFAELRLIAKAKRNNFQVVKDQTYIRQNNIAEGELYTFKAIPEMHQLCLKYDHYEH
jgi:hypothetical protein